MKRGLWRIGGTVAGGLMLAAAVPGRTPLGQFDRWGAFRDAAPVRCYAIAQPAGAGREDRAALTVASWPRLRARGQVGVRLQRAASAAVLEIGAARFPLIVRGEQAWSADLRADARIARLMHGGGVLVIRARDAGGRRWSNRYPLEGAGSAIDAMRLGCLAG